MPVKKRYEYDSPLWYRLRKLWKKFLIIKGKGDILEAQKLAREIQSCQRDLNVPVANFEQLLSVVLWE